MLLSHAGGGLEARDPLVGCWWALVRPHMEMRPWLDFISGVNVSIHSSQVRHTGAYNCAFMCSTTPLRVVQCKKTHIKAVWSSPPPPLRRMFVHCVWPTGQQKRLYKVSRLTVMGTQWHPARPNKHPVASLRLQWDLKAEVSPATIIVSHCQREGSMSLYSLKLRRRSRVLL